jgi:phosphatidylcholine synthase
MPDTTYSAGRRAAAWGVHAYTALGLPINLVGAYALLHQDARLFFLSQVAAIFVDATDGFMARAVDVKNVVPEFSGRRLDDIVDFITFSFMPAIALVQLGMIPEAWGWFAAVPLLASGYGFCQERAKTDESFVGFPSYWNIVLVYLYVLGATPPVVVGVLAVLAVLVFVPIHYVYPSRTRMLRAVTIGLGIVWSTMLAIVCWNVESDWAVPLTWASLFYVVYYVAISAVNHVQMTRARTEA